MTNLQNAILKACNNDVITTHEANALLESSYYSIPILKSSERLPMSVIGMAKGYIQSMAKMVDCRNFCISVQRTFLPVNFIIFLHHLKIENALEELHITINSHMKESMKILSVFLILTKLMQNIHQNGISHYT